MMPCVRGVHRKDLQKILDNCVIGFILSTLRIVPTLCRAQKPNPLPQDVSIVLVPERETDDVFCTAYPATG